MKKEIQNEAGEGFGVILLIEDDEVVMDVGRAMIEKLGYKVLPALTGKEAIDLAQNYEGLIDMAMLDMDIPDMKGDEIFPYLVEARPQMKIVVCSGDFMGSGTQSLIDSGAHEFLQKPYSFKMLEGILVKYMDRRNEPRVPADNDFLAVSDQKGVYSIRLIDISRGGLSFACDDSKTDEDALVDVAVMMAGQGVDLDELECRIVSEKTLDHNDLEKTGPLKRKSVSFGRMTKKQFDKLTELIQACSKKE